MHRFRQINIFNVAPMQLGNIGNYSHRPIPCTDSGRCLGVYVVGNNKQSFGFAHVKRCFYAACNNEFAHVNQLDQSIQLTLIESNYLPLLALCYSQFDIHTMSIA